MKAAERRHLRENELVGLVADITERIQPYRGVIIGVVAGMVVVVLGFGGYSWWRDRAQSQATAALAEAMVVLEARVVPPAPSAGTSAPPAAATQPAGTYPNEQAKVAAALPKLKAAADAYPNTQPGIVARYQLASALLETGKPAEAVGAFAQVIAADATGIYGRMAQLGKAEAHAAAGQYDQAIAIFKELAAKKDGDVPADAVLMQLGRTYVAAGRSDDAAKSFQQVIEQYPDSPYQADAKKALDEIRNRTA